MGALYDTPKRLLGFPDVTEGAAEVEVAEAKEVEDVSRFVAGLMLPLLLMLMWGCRWVNVVGTAAAFVYKEDPPGPSSSVEAAPAAPAAEVALGNIVGKLFEVVRGRLKPDLDLGPGCCCDVVVVLEKALLIEPKPEADAAAETLLLMLLKPIDEAMLEMGRWRPEPEAAEVAEVLLSPPVAILECVPCPERKKKHIFVALLASLSIDGVDGATITELLTASLMFALCSDVCSFL